MSMPAQYAGRRIRPPAGTIRPHPASQRGRAVGVPSAVSRLRTLRDRVRWTLVFSAFFAFSGGVMASRLSIGQPMMVLGLVGVLMQTEPVRFGAVPVLLALWTAWSALGAFSSPYPDETIESLLQLCKLCVIVFVGVNALRTRGQIRAYCIFLLVAFLIYPGRGSLLNWLTGAYVIEGSRAVWNGVYSNPNDLAGICLLLISVALAVAAGETVRRYKLAALGTAGFIAFIIFLTQSRGALISLGVFVVVVLRRMPKHQRMKAALVAGALGAVVVVFAPSRVWDRLSGLKGVTDTEHLDRVDSSAEQRFEIWKVARTMIAEHPITGVGIGAYPDEHAQVAMRPQFNPIARGKRDTHSMYLNVIAETGIPGFLILTCLLLTTVRYVDRVRRRASVSLPQQALQLQFFELGLLAFCVAAIWGSYAKLNVFYLHLVLMWTAAKTTEREMAARMPQPLRVR